MTKLIVLFIIGQLLFIANARPAPGELLSDLKTKRFDAFGPLDNTFDPFGPIDDKFVTSPLPAPLSDFRASTFDAFGTVDNGFDPFGPIDDTFNPALFPDLRRSRFDAFGAIDDPVDPFGPIEVPIDPYTQNNVILPNYFKDLVVSRSGGEYFDSSSSFDFYNDLVYGPDFLLNNAPFLQGYPFGPMFPFAADMSFDMLSFRPVMRFAKSLEDIDSYFGDESRDLFDYFGGTFDSKGDAGEFGGNLASFFSQIYDGPLLPPEDILAG